MYYYYFIVFIYFIIFHYLIIYPNFIFYLLLFLILLFFNVIFRVIANDLSISVSSWTDSEEAVIYYDKIRTHVLPFESEWSKEEFSIGLKLFIDSLVYTVTGNRY